MRTARRTALLGAGILVAVALAACSSPEDGAAAAGATGDAATVAAEAGTDAPPATSARVADIDPADVVAEQTYTVPGSQDTVTVGLHSLVVDGEVMTLHLFFTPEFSSVSDDAAISVFDMVGSGFGPTLVDRQNLKEYTILSENITTDWEADQVYTEATNGEPVLWWAGFAAPQDDIDTIDVRVLDELPEFTDVPIVR
ncbi:hypothetical protein FE374_13000 [Georgenia yuyongxinii]|uniref:Lipoprotein n=1 Tax=Georgenia yuyongxinii TaxID=2589797 RepID=A0A5B8CB82_9MICO|nr:hypothetical protein [Georgenia yuyongxinii]QDC25406.1 hypothetical protein FE374_13000 [Georgenia yuyongxinii]